MYAKSTAREARPVHRVPLRECARVQEAWQVLPPLHLYGSFGRRTFPTTTTALGQTVVECCVAILWQKRAAQLRRLRYRPRHQGSRLIVHAHAAYTRQVQLSRMQTSQKHGNWILRRTSP